MRLDIYEILKDAVGGIQSQVLEHDEARQILHKRVMWISTVFLGMWLAKETEEKQSLALMFVSIASFSPVEDVLW